MRKITPAVFCLLLFFGAYGQVSIKCIEYEKCMERASSLFLKEKLEDARREYSTAKIFAKECGVSDSLADKGILAVIEKYKEQKDNAEKAKEEAIKQKLIAQKAQKEADIQRGNAENAKQETERQLKKIQENENQIMQLKESATKQQKSIREYLVNERLKNGQDTSASAMNEILTNISKSNNGEGNRPEIFTKRRKTRYPSSNIYSTPVFSKAKHVIDSILNAYTKNQKFSNNTENNEEALSHLTNRLDRDISFNIVAKHVLDSSGKELKKIIPGTIQYDLTVYTYLRSVVYYSWNLADKGNDSLLLAKKQLDEAVAFCNKLPYRSAIIYSGMAGLYNSYNKHYDKVQSWEQAYEAIKTSIDYSINAVRLQPGCYLFQRSLGGLLGNVTYSSDYRSDSLISLMDKVELAKLSYKCLKNMEIYFPYTGNSIKELCNSANNLSNRLMDVNDYSNAIETQKSTIDILNQYVAHNKTNGELEIKKLKLFTKVAIIYVDSLNNFDSGMKYLNEAYSFFNAIKLDTAGNADVERLVELNASSENLIEYAKNRQDSLSAITTYSNAILAYEKIAPLGRNKYNSFSEDVYQLAQPYVRRLELNVWRSNKEEIEKDYTILERTFLPSYLKYRFDFYLGQPLIKASKIYAYHLCREGKYKKALPLLKFTSLEGAKESTDSLIAIYQKREFANADSVKFYRSRTGYQSTGMKRFTVPTDFSGVKYPFHIYITDKAKEYDTAYTGIRDQVEWVSKARGGKIPEDVIESFDKLQKIAWENDVSFMELSVYAFGQVKEDSSKTKENDRSSKLKKEMDGADMLSLLALSKQYAAENDNEAIDLIYNKIKIKIAELYASLCWEYILSKHYSIANYYVTEGLKYDPTSVYLKRNVPHLALLTNNFEDAKKIYLDYKNIAFDNTYKTYRDAFLADLGVFERTGIKNEHFAELRKLLN